ncbi:Alpha/Beta hydrolase [Parasponia andersonii]|uniref:Alpha/Beta hydrolase n=1 Tax=Parasponia andersonii TaxID=3476 RepID=A0A2P5CRE6_PARAD|nr:Alpha/Beta hydrolase [Parasponia andersonii]
MVHGIGQRLEKSNLVDDVSTFRHITAGLAERHLTPHQSGIQRVLFIPCQWRKGLKLSGETAVEKITLDGVRGLRVMLSATAHDVLYYMSPIYCQAIINSVSNQLNHLYLKFLKRNPGYDGKVSIYGHSLGSVLSYDILCHQENLSSPFPMDLMYKEQAKGENFSHDNSKQSTMCNSSTNPEDKSSSAINDTENMVGPTDYGNENSSTKLEDKNSCAINDSEDMVGPIDYENENSTKLEDKNSSAINDREDMVDPIDDANESTSPALNQEDVSKIVSNLGDKSSSVVYDEDLIASADDEKRDTPPTHLVHEEGLSDGNTEDASTIVDIVASDFNVLTESAINSKQSSGKEDVHESIYESSNLDLDNRDILDETTIMSSAVCVDTSEHMFKEMGEDEGNKDHIIESLTKEIDFLKVKIAELELQYGHGDRSPWLHEENKDMSTTVVKQPKFDKLPHDHHDSLKSYTPHIKYTKLEFKVDTFFAVGSPLGVFLALRNIRIGIGKGQEYWGEENIHEEMPACRQMFNIFHPFDPVAYRIEHLVCKEYISKRPLIVPYHKGGKRLHIGFKEFAEDVASRSQAIVDHLTSARDKVLTVCQSRNDPEEGEETAEHREERSYGSLMMEKLTGSTEGRIDHMLQDKTFQHQYIAAIGSHTNYWRDYDTALFILKHLYRDIPEDPNSPEASNGEDLKNESGSIGLSDQRETTEEELPLTFSDKSMVRSFSSRAKKLLKKH